MFVKQLSVEAHFLEDFKYLDSAVLVSRIQAFSAGTSPLEKLKIELDAAKGGRLVDPTFQYEIPDKLGLTPKQEIPLFDAVTELLRNVWHGMVGGHRAVKKATRTSFAGAYFVWERCMELAFIQARDSEITPVELRVQYDQDSRDGQLEVCHALIPGFALRSSLGTSVRNREIETQGTRLVQGGITSMQTGEIATRLKENGLLPGRVEMADEGQLRHMIYRFGASN